ncbi:MAG TPA: ATP-binding cassette domain-containing protein, partial [Acidimicrobiales bacterium]
MTVVLEGTDLGYAVGDRRILDGVFVRAPSGRVLGVRGPSGSGKSSLLTVLGGLIAPSNGTVTLDGAPVSPDSDLTVRRRFGFVLQGYGLVAALTARENVAIVLQAARVPRDQVRSRVQAVLESVRLAPVADHLIEDLSGGQQQRVAVARALFTQPDVFLADEPTAELDDASARAIRALIVQLARTEGTSVLLVTHDL